MNENLITSFVIVFMDVILMQIRKQNKAQYGRKEKTWQSKRKTQQPHRENSTKFYTLFLKNNFIRTRG